MKNIKPKHILLASLAAALILGIYYVVFPGKFLPGEFTDARIKGATVAQRIVELSRDTLSQLNQVSQYDQQRRTSEALIVISNAVLANRESQAEAIRLSSQLNAMAENLSRIKPDSARQIATEAVTAEVALASRLIYYNAYLAELFETLKVKLQRPKAYYLDGQVNDLINKINDEAQAINELNKKFNSAMAELDGIFGR